MTMTFSPRAVEAALAKFNEVINDPIMEPCPRCEAKGYHHGFGLGGVEPDWCENCGGNQYNIRPGEEKRAMESALAAALAVDGVALVPREPTKKMVCAGCNSRVDGWNDSYYDDEERSEIVEWVKDGYRAMLAAASDGEER